MSTNTMQSLKRLARERLGAYRQENTLLKSLDAGKTDAQISRITGRVIPPPTPQQVRAMRQWNLAIRNAVRMLEKSHRDKSRFMVRYFGLETPINRSQSPAARLIRLSQDYSVAQSTLYSWIDDICHIVLLCAAETGALRLSETQKLFS